MRYIFLAPHLDDGVLSCGEIIAKLVLENHEVTLATFFTGTPQKTFLSPAAKQYHSNCFLGDDSMTFRKGEDINACSILGCIPKHLDLLECLYRRNVSGEYLYPSLDNIYHVEPTDTIIKDQIEALLLGMLNDYDVAFAPLGLGDHSDHLIISSAMRSISKKISCRVLFYEEVPYICYEDEIIPKEKVRGMKRIPIVVSNNHWEKKLNAVLCYRSQLHIMWKNADIMVSQLYRHLNGSSDKTVCFWEIEGTE